MSYAMPGRALGATDEQTTEEAFRVMRCTNMGGTWTGTLCDWSAVCDRVGQVWTGDDTAEPSCRPFEDKPKPPVPGPSGGGHLKPSATRSSATYVIPVVLVLGGLYYLVRKS